VNKKSGEIAWEAQPPKVEIAEMPRGGFGGGAETAEGQAGIAKVEIGQPAIDQAAIGQLRIDRRATGPMQTGALVIGKVATVPVEAAADLGRDR
jgi:hypothetical protein